MKHILTLTGRMLATASIVIALVLFSSGNAAAQTNIGGVINTYTKVTAISNGCSCPTTNCATVTVSSAAGFAANDIVLLFQMKGARADSSNTPTHGDILSLFDAGNYEFDTIASIAGSVITFKVPLKQTYFTSSNPADSAYVQLIKVPVYSGDVNVTGTLTPQAWSATTGTGGVLAFWLTGTLTLQANISADGRGFAAATRLQVAVSCDLDTAFYYQSTSWNHASCTSCGYAYDDAVTRRVGQAAYGGCGTTCYTNRMYINDQRSAGYRGEGVVANTFKKTFANSNVANFIKGKAHWGNGGGGGGNHNAGGGGGGGYAAGGWGGNMYNVSSTDCPTAYFSTRRGYGGVSLTPTATKIFMGGGGGEGHDNGGGGSTGTTGGGIIMIKAASVANSASYTISANGTDNTFSTTNDGSGGGGAGGSILLDVSGSYTNAVTISAKGGKGGDHSQSSCHGTGAGGGGGLLWFSTTGGSVPANVTTNVTGGSPGSNVHPSFNCGTATWGATAGSAGGILTGLASGASVFLNMNDCSAALPIVLSSFRADVTDEKVSIQWTTASEIDNDYFSVERSENGHDFTSIIQIDGAGNSTAELNYSAADEHPLFGTSYYRLKQTDFDGRASWSQTASIKIEKTPQLSIYPNPADNYFIISYEGVRSFSVVITSVTGNTFYERKNNAGETRISAQDFPKGIYYVKVYSGKTMAARRMIIM